MGAAISAAGTTAPLVGQDTGYTGVAAFAVALAVMVGAHLVASSTIAELGMFVASYDLLQTTIEAFRPEPNHYFDYEMTPYDRYAPLALVLFGVLWALVGSRLRAHRELAVFVGMGSGVLGFWRFLVDGRWPWLAVRSPASPPWCSGLWAGRISPPWRSW